MQFDRCFPETTLLYQLVQEHQSSDVTV